METLCEYRKKVNSACCLKTIFICSIFLLGALVANAQIIAEFKSWNIKTLGKPIHVSFENELDSVSAQIFKDVMQKKMVTDTNRIFISKTGKEYSYEISSTYQKDFNITNPGFISCGSTICKGDAGNCGDTSLCIAAVKFYYTGRTQRILSFLCYEAYDKSKNLHVFICKKLSKYIAPLQLATDGAILKFENKLNGQRAVVSSISNNNKIK